MITRSRFVSFVVAAGACAGAAHAQTITDGNSTFSLTAANTAGALVRTGTGGGTGGTFVAGGDTSDHLFQHWWWYRVNGVNTREFALSNRTAVNASGNRVTLDYAEPEGVNFRVIYQLTDGADAPASANVAASVEITNVSSGPISLAVMGYLDYDLEATLADSATLLEPGRIQINDSTPFFGQFMASGANAYRVSAFSVARATLTDGDIDDADNSGLPFAAADFSGLWQWNVQLPAGGSTTIRSAFSLNTTAVPEGAVSGCDDIDFNNNDAFPEDQDVIDFFTVLAGGECSAGNTCNDIDFNNNGAFPEDQDVIDFFNVLAGGTC